MAVAGPQLTSKVEITVSCRNLPDRDVMSKSDPMCVLLTGTGKSQHEVGRTECISNTLNPDFNRKFQVDFCFEERQQAVFRIYDVDSARQVLSDHDFLGELETTIGELVSRRRFEATLNKTGSPKRSVIVLTCLELQECKLVANFRVEGRKLDKKDFFGKSDPYLEIFQPMEDIVKEADVSNVRSWLLVHRTEVIKQNLNPQWAPFSIPMARLCRGNKQLLLRFDCHDYDNDGSHDFIGSFYSSVESLEQEVARSRSAQKTLMSKKHKSAGTIVFSQLAFESVDSFVDYLQGGTELHFTVAIDFTGSNGDPRDQRSLHYISPDGRPNQYELAIVSVGEVVQDYDSDKQFPALGFGALLPPRFSGVQDAFAITLQPENPYCAGMQGLLGAYRSCIRAVRLYGPTNFSPVINHVASMARAHQTGAQYFVLLIITDGIITDFQATKEAIIRGSSLPMSIIIVGVGDEDFSAMEELDSDDKRLRSGSMIAERDIVQFVPLRKFLQGGSIERSRYALAKEVLAELPNQVCEWMKRHGVKAGPPRARQDAAPPHPTAPAGVPVPPSFYPGQSVNGVPGYPGAPPAVPGYPGAPPAVPGYPGASSAAPSYPAASPGYPNAAPSYPAASPGYPAASLGYPAASPGYPAASLGYPAASPGYPAASSSAPGYPNSLHTAARSSPGSVPTTGNQTGVSAGAQPSAPPP